MSAVNFDALMQKVRAAFADAPRPADDALVCHECEECHHLRADLRGRTPEELPDAWVEGSFDQLPLMSDDAKRYYLPAYLRVAARHPQSTVTMFVLFALSADHRWQPEGGYTRAQRQAILDFLAFIEPHVDPSETADVIAARRRWRDVI